MMSLDRKKEAGFSLIEIMIALAIMALVAGGAAISYRTVKRSQLVSSVNQLAGAIKYTRDRAMTSGQYYRLRFYFQEQSYDLEKSQDRVFLKKDSLSETNSSSQENNQDNDELFEILPKNAKFEKGSDSIAKKIQLNSSIVLRFVKTARQDLPVSSGVASLYFFPDGHVESAWICMSRKDEPELSYSLEVKSLNGRVLTKPGCPSPVQMQ